MTLSYCCLSDPPNYLNQHCLFCKKFRLITSLGVMQGGKCVITCMKSLSENGLENYDSHLKNNS